IVTQIIASKAPLFEKASIDEFYVDLSGMDVFFDALKWTIDLRETITRETGLPISFGIGKNKLIAKMATNEAKPNGYFQIPIGKEKDFLAPLSVSKIPGVGTQLNEILNYHGIKLIRDLHQSSPERLQTLAGNRGFELWNRAQGTHTSVLNPYREAKSISKENTFDENITDVNFLLAEIVRMVEKISFELRKDEKSAGCVAIKIKYPDFTTSSKQVSITSTSADEEIIPVARELFHKLYKKGTPVRLLGVKVSELNNNAVQTNLFQHTEKRSGLYKAMDEVKNRFGNTSVFRASGK
ncbi:MAG: DNA polymerase IV, partial [Gelidibacter sp.]